MNGKTRRCKATDLEEAPVLADPVEACRLLAMVQQQLTVINDGDLSLTVTNDGIRCSLWPEIPRRHVGSAGGRHHGLNTRDGERFHLLPAALEMLLVPWIVQSSASIPHALWHT
jgi:hypothetical protein